MKPSRSEVFNTHAAEFAGCIVICAVLPIGIIALIAVRLCEAAFDSKAGKAAYKFWFGRRT